MSRKSLVDIRECVLCFFNSQQPDSICIKSSCCQPGQGVVDCGEYHWTSSNGRSSTTQLSPMARGSEFPLASMSMLLLWETKVIELKKEFQVVVFRLDFDLLHEVMSWPEVWHSRTGSELKKYFQASWVPELVPRPLLSPCTSSQASTSPRTGSQASFKSRNWFQGLFRAPGMKENDLH